MSLEAKRAQLTGTSFTQEKNATIVVSEDSPGKKRCNSTLKPLTPVCQISTYFFFHELSSILQHSVNIWMMTAMSAQLFRHIHPD